MTIGSGFLFWNLNFCVRVRVRVVYKTENDSTVYFNKVRYLFGMNNQLRDGPFRGVYVFFLKKYSDSGGGKKKI